MKAVVQLDAFEAAANRDAGIALSVSHADEVNPGWSEKAAELLKEFLLQHNGPFMVEELRSYAALVDFELPPSGRAWGGVIRRAAFAGIVEKVGIKNTSSVKSHATPATVWQKI